MRLIVLSVVNVLIISSYCENVIANNVHLTDVIQTHSGPVRGFFKKNVLTGVPFMAFTGIRYAEPPLKELRFLPPVEAKPWHKVHNAIRYGSICPQIRNGHYQGDEDCLFLNIYTPMINIKKSAKKLKAVMVWIHGGAFMQGSGNDMTYGPDYIVDKDVILVTFNYRLGPIGFINLGHEKIPGNAGLKDQNLVLKWVQKNIIHFGGNPKNVTLVGQSAGSVSVDMHNIAKSSQGLYARSIAMSGSAFCPWGFSSFKTARKHAIKLTNVISNCKWCLDYPDVIVNLLQNASAKLLVTSVPGMIKQFFKLKLLFVPSIEVVQYNNKTEPFIDECFVDKFKKGEYHKGDHIMGFTSAEAGVVINTAGQVMEKAWNKVYNMTTNLWNKIWRRSKRSLINLDRLVEPLSDIGLVTGVDMKHEFLMNFNHLNSVYYYFFNYTSQNSYINGVGHTEELRYIFHNQNQNPSLTDGTTKYHPDAITRNRFVTMFTNFAKYGKPTHPYVNSHDIIDVEWEKSHKFGGYLEIGRDLVMNQNARPISKFIILCKKLYYNQFAENECIPEVAEIMKSI